MNTSRILLFNAALPFALLLWLAPATYPQGSESVRCKASRQQWDAILRSAANESPLQRFHGYLRFLERLPEEPETCVSGDVAEQIGVTERKLIGLIIDNHRVDPNKVMHCGQIEPGTQKCRGQEGDDTTLIPESDALSRLAVAPRSGTVILSMNPSYQGHVIGAFGGSRAMLQDGGDPLRLGMKGTLIDVAALSHFQDPLVIVITERKDTLGFRKFVWFLSR